MLLLEVGCFSNESATSPAPVFATHVSEAQSDLEEVRSADVSILFVGNSHTSNYDLPGLISKMIRFRHPKKTVCTHVIGVGFLEEVAHDHRCKVELESRPWKHLVLQAQKESRSGRFKYSTTEGINVAKLGKANRAQVTFFSEWGLKKVPTHGQRIERIYDEMAKASGADVAPVGRAWDLALATRPDLPLYSQDGNPQSAVGAFLTAAVLFGQLTGESPTTLASLPYKAVGEADRKFLAEVASKALVQKAAELKKK